MRAIVSCILEWNIIVNSKSTIAALVCRLLEPASGRILWDGTPVTELSTASLRSRIALVPQDPFLFHDTIRTNLEIGSPGATDEALRAALGVADAEALVDGLDGGLDAVVGEEGQTLSGGERQRICMARAALRDASLLILDEAASSLDAASEESVRRGFERMSTGRTVLVIGHRLSSIRSASRIHVLENGRIVESGTIDDLSRPGTAFHRLFESQLTGG
jgi:ABC-type multidrug transport system fused ATPase/permease subunit